jgi:hypothetical protein
MSHPFLEVVGAVAVVVAIGAGTLLVLPRRGPESPIQSVVLDVERVPVQRVEPDVVKSDEERIDDLRRQLRRIAAEQEQLLGDLRTAALARSQRLDRRRQPDEPR